jgi:hypothetical protein
MILFAEYKQQQQLKMSKSSFDLFASFVVVAQLLAVAGMVTLSIQAPSASTTATSGLKN